MARVVLRRADANSVLEERRANGYKDFVSLDSPTYGQTSMLKTDPRVVTPRSKAEGITGPRDEKYVLVDGRYRLNANYNPPFDITLGQAIGIPPLVGIGGALLPEAAAFVRGALTAAKAVRASGSANKIEKYIKQGFSPEEATELARPYTGRGHHYVPQNRPVTIFKGLPEVKGLPPRLSESRFNVLKPRGMTKGDFYELHYKVDPSFHGARIPGPGRNWSGKQLGLKEYGRVGRLWYGSPATLKIAVGAGGAGGAGVGYLISREDD